MNYWESSSLNVRIKRESTEILSKVLRTLSKCNSALSFCPLRLNAFAMGGYGLGGQGVTSGTADGNIPQLSTPGALVGIGTYGEYLPAGPVGMFWDVNGPLQLGSGPVVDAYVGPAVALGPLSLWPGVGLTTVTVTDIDGARTAIVPQSHLGLWYRHDLSDRLQLDTGAGGGWAVILSAAAGASATACLGQGHLQCPWACKKNTHSVHVCLSRALL